MASAARSCLVVPAMNEKIRSTISALEYAYPGYHVWYVPHAVSPSRFCAKRHDGRGKPLSGTTEAELSEYIAAEIDQLSEEDQA